MRNITILSLVVAAALGLTACSASGAPQSASRAREHKPTSAIGAVPGTLPSRLCTSSIYSGANYSAVVRTPDDIVVGPLRFGTLRQATGKGIYTFQADGRLTFGFKSPLTIAGTSSPWVVVRVVSDNDQVKVDYNPFGSAQTAGSSADVAALETAVACGGAEAAFVQYNGGFTWQHATCATVQAFNQKGRLLGSMTIPFGKRSC